MFFLTFCIGLFVLASSLFPLFYISGKHISNQGHSTLETYFLGKAPFESSIQVHESFLEISCLRTNNIIYPRLQRLQWAWSLYSTAVWICVIFVCANFFNIVLFGYWISFRNFFFSWAGHKLLSFTRHWWISAIFWIADSNHSWRLPGLGPQAMSTSTRGTFSSSRSIGNVKNEPDHLLVLVHGIMARYTLIIP